MNARFFNASELAQRLKARRSGRQWVCCCPVHEDREPSLIIFDGRESVQVRCLAGCDPGDVVAELRRRGLWEDSRQFSRQTDSSQTVLVRDASAPAASAAERHREQAQLIFSNAMPIAGTAAWRYFEGRDLLAAAFYIPDIRFAPACPRGSNYWPAIVVAMRDIKTRSVHAIQRIFLAAAGFGTVVKDGHPMMLGPASGCAMQLVTVQTVQTVQTLHIAEGLESALAVMAMDHKPVWAMGSASMIASMPVIEGVDNLVIWADHDRPNPVNGQRAGEHAARICGRRWAAAGRTVDMVIPVVEGWDAADVWSDRCAR